MVPVTVGAVVLMLASGFGSAYFRDRYRISGEYRDKLASHLWLCVLVACLFALAGCIVALVGQILHPPLGASPVTVPPGT